MKKTFVFLIGLVMAGTLAYFGGYYFYISDNPKTEFVEPMTLQRAVQLSDTDLSTDSEEYYIAKIEQDMLMIYQMPGKILYDSVEISSLHFTEKEQPRLLEGMIFQNLTEVFEFLENSMS